MKLKELQRRVKAQRYIIKQNESLVWIAHNFYRNGAMWRVIAKFNGIQNPFQDLSFKEILIPDLDELERILGKKPLDWAREPDYE